MFSLSGGNFQSAGVPVSNGSVILILSNPSATVKATGAAATVVYTINLDSLGNMPLTQVWGNGELSPDATFYTAQIFSGANGTGTLLFTATWTVGPSAPYSGTLYPNVMVLPAVSFSGGLICPSSTVAFSATPAFNAALASCFRITLTGSVTSSTLIGVQSDQLLIFEIIQDGVGGHPFAWPTSFADPDAVDQSAGAKNIQMFRWDATDSKAYAITKMTVR